MDDDKVKMPADGPSTEMAKSDDIRETASRRDAHLPGAEPNPGESGGGPYPNPHSGKDRPKFHGGQSVVGFQGKGRPGSKKLEETPNARTVEN